MSTSECEVKISRDPKFCERDQNGQIEKLRYELQIALRAISNIGNKVAVLKEHQHDNDGKVLIRLDRDNRAFQVDRSKFLD